MRINFLVNATPNPTLKLMMDPQSGDYITLNGNGVLRANWFNKGSFDMFGNYVVDHGVYKLTIQNVIKKDFEFMPGGTIAFGGNPYNAPLNLQAKYTVNGVPLSDLKHRPFVQQQQHPSRLPDEHHGHPSIAERRFLNGPAYGEHGCQADDLLSHQFAGRDEPAGTLSARHRTILCADQEQPEQRGYRPAESDITGDAEFPEAVRFRSSSTPYYRMW